MMSKERLEELKKMRLLYEVCFVDDYASAIDDITADFDLLIKLVQELEEENRFQLSETHKNLDKVIYLDKENQRYKQALEFYADEDKWYEINTGSPYVPDYRREIEDDMGEVARKALEER